MRLGLKVDQFGKAAIRADLHPAHRARHFLHDRQQRSRQRPMAFLQKHRVQLHEGSPRGAFNGQRQRRFYIPANRPPPSLGVRRGVGIRDGRRGHVRNAPGLE
ncbi:unnamed protein product [Phytomonas sp. Hart1]|nr:unnamed protein product [Phytomonas sp. Hart1]|eukprot:CCW67156.1 unnamed protein product [Phytomonas sp. isolate Hart1]